jgi:outer membrane protein insertion porin family
MKRAWSRWLRVVLWGLLLLPRIAAAQESERLLPATLVQLDIVVDAGIASELDWPALARALLGVEEGDRLSAERLQEALRDLTTLARVESDITAVDGGVRLRLGVRPYQRIKSIAILGNYPLFDRDVANAMTVSPGDLFVPEAIPGQAELIEQRYRDEGYIDPRVRIAWTQDAQDGHYHIEVDIEKGDFFQRGPVRFEGNEAFGDIYLHHRMSGWRTFTSLLGGERFVAADFEAAARELTAFYRKAGYADVTITHEVRQDLRTRQTESRIRIEEGPHYAVSFTGNRFHSDRQLRDDLALFAIGNRGNIGLRRSIHSIRQRYLRSGFTDVSVQWEEVTPAGVTDRRELAIIIDEGARHVVDQVYIRGNQALDDEAIREQMLTQPPRLLDAGAYAAEVLAEDMNAIRSLYLSSGFLEARITDEIRIDPQTQRVTVFVDIREGVQTRIGRIGIQGDTPLTAEQLLAALPFAAGDPFRPYLLQSAADALAAQISPLGYPHVQVRDQIDISADGSRADIDFYIERGPLVQVGSIFFAGNFKTREGVLARELGFKPGQPFSLTEVLVAQRNLRNLGLFDSVQVRTIGLREKAPRVPMLIELRERKPYYFETGLGYQTDRGPYFRSRVGNNNFRGKNQEIWTGGEVSEVGYRWDAGLSNPRLLGTRITADMGLFSERQELFNQEFGTQTSGGSVLFSRAFGPRISTSLGWRYEYREQFLLDGAGGTVEAVDPRSILVTTPAVRYDSRDSFIQPRQGWVSTLSVDISSGLENSLDNFLRYRFDARYFYTPISRLTLATMARVGYLSAYGGSADVPQDQLFYLGGIADVRGFGENMLRFDDNDNPVGGRLALNGTLEARYDLGRNFELSTFVDSGSLRETQVAAEGDDDFRWSVGLSLRYVTPIGPIGLIYGHKLNPQADESPGQFHFTIGYTF